MHSPVQLLWYSEVNNLLVHLVFTLDTKCSYLVDDVLVVAGLGEEEPEEDGEERGLRDAPQEELHVRRRADQLGLRHLRRGQQDEISRV